jgi:hypothetical protein
MKKMNNDIMHGRTVENKCVRNIFVLKTSVLCSGIGGLCMHTTSLACLLTDVTSI